MWRKLRILFFLPLFLSLVSCGGNKAEPDAAQFTMLQGDQITKGASASLGDLPQPDITIDTVFEFKNDEEGFFLELYQKSYQDGKSQEEFRKISQFPQESVTEHDLEIYKHDYLIFGHSEKEIWTFLTSEGGSFKISQSMDYDQKFARFFGEADQKNTNTFNVGIVVYTDNEETLDKVAKDPKNWQKLLDKKDTAVEYQVKITH